MNINARPYNKGAKHTRYQVTTPQEARHQLKGAKVFSEFNMGNGFHQVPLTTCSQVIFQSHMGLHRMKRLFFGPTNSSGIFHHKVTKVFTGLKGCITIHDNLLVFGKDEDEQNRNMVALLERAKEKGVTLNLAKSTICVAEVKWFQTAGVETEDPYLRLKNYLKQFRATPHATMRKCPAELLFGRKFVTKLPDMRTNPAKARKDIMEAKEDDRGAKDKMKKYKDAGRPIREHGIKVGDLVISKRKITKHDSAYDPKPYKVVATYSTQIKDMQEDGKYKTRDSQKWKRVQVQDRRSYGEVERPSRYLDETNIGAGAGPCRVCQGQGRGAGRVCQRRGCGASGTRT